MVILETIRISNGEGLYPSRRGYAISKANAKRFCLGGERRKNLRLETSLRERGDETRTFLTLALLAFPNGVVVQDHKAQGTDNNQPVQPNTRLRVFTRRGFLPSHQKPDPSHLKPGQ